MSFRWTSSPRDREGSVTSGGSMHTLIGRLGPYAKPLVILAAIVVATVAQWAGVDLGLDVTELWAALGAAVLAFLVPAPGYRAPSESDPQALDNLHRNA